MSYTTANGDATTASSHTTQSVPGTAAATSGAVIDSDMHDTYEYDAPWMIYAMNWSVRIDKPYRIALGSFIENYNNEIEIIEFNKELHKFQVTNKFTHPYPTTKLMFVPNPSTTKTDLLATTGDYLRLWKIGDNTTNNTNDSNKTSMISLLNNNKNTEYCAPLTSFDWNEIDNRYIGTSSIDTTCTIWDIETNQSKCQLIAHDKEVYDMAFAPNSTELFSSSGADGSVRMFDLRSLDHSTIVYESPELQPLLRVTWNKIDPNYLATIMIENNTTVILDIRRPSRPIVELRGHTGSVNTGMLAYNPYNIHLYIELS